MIKQRITKTYIPTVRGCVFIHPAQTIGWHLWLILNGDFKSDSSFRETCHALSTLRSLVQTLWLGRRWLVAIHNFCPYMKIQDCFTILAKLSTVLRKAISFFEMCCSNPLKLKNASQSWKALVPYARFALILVLFCYIKSSILKWEFIVCSFLLKIGNF